MNNSEGNKRIAKNTIVLYIRMILVLFVGLFTSRVVLNTLGVENYGIYNVVGGFVLIFGFLNGAMANATQRFVTMELARGELSRQIKTFSTSVNLHIVLSVIIVILAETIGLWLFYEKMVIPQDRMNAAMWVYQLSIATIVMSIISVPYNALIIAHEKMSAFAWLSIFDVTLKLIIVYLLTIAPFDKLIFYAWLLFLVQVIDQAIYIWYCLRNFTEARYKLIVDRDMFKGMSNIAGWSLFGNIAGVGYTQGLNVLLNMFFGPAVNAARGIAVTVQGVVSGFAGNIQMAINPQITKSYALADFQRMHSLIYASSKFCFFLLFIFIVPIFMETEAILTVWLKIVPDHTVWFVRLILCVMLTDTLANPLMISSQAVGKVKVYQSVVGGTLLLIVPISYIALKLGGNPESVFIIQLIMSAIATTFRIIIVGKMINMNFTDYFKQVLVRIISVFISTLALTFCIKLALPESIFMTVIMIILSPIISLLAIACIGLNDGERQFAYMKITKTVRSKIGFIIK